MKDPYAIRIFTGLISVFLFWFLLKEYREYNYLKLHKDVTSYEHKLCESPDEHEAFKKTINTRVNTLSCQEEVNEKLKKNIFRIINGDELIYKY